jgi:uncharacterized protein
VRTIDLENHFVTELYVDTLRSRTTAPRIEEGKGLAYHEDAWIPIGATGAQPKLRDMGEGRIREMDAAGVDVAILSLTAPGVEPLEPTIATEIAKDANDRLADYVAKYPDRLAGMATIAPKDPDAAVKELERCVRELGFRGWHTHSNFGDSYIDEERYWPILAKAEELDIPIYLHPTAPRIPELRTFGICLSGPTFGFGTEVMFVFLRMIHRGVFDAFPRLKIILGHFGEAFPFLLDRVDTAYRQGYAEPNPEIGPGSKELASHYVLNNMWVTTSGNYLPAAYYCTREAIGLEKILLATDHPFEQMHLGIDFIKGLPISDAERAQVCEANAMALGFAG